MRKLFLKISMLLFVLGMSVNAAWGQDEVKIYFASLKAQSSPESTGSGLVKLTWVDITGAPLTVNLAKQLNYAAFQNLTWMGKECAYDGFGESAQVLGGTMSALDGMETMIAMKPQIFMTSLVYYYAQAQPANGSYLVEWTFTDPAITRVTEPMGGEGTYVAMYNDNQEVQYDNPLISPCFKVLPDSANNAIYSETEEAMAVVGAKAYEVANTPGKYNNLYAVFNKYLLSNPQAENGHMNANESSATFKVSVDVEGDASQLKADYADFEFPASDFVDNAEGKWSWAHDSENPIENISASKTRYNFIITFAPKTTDVGRKNATLTIRMAHADPSKASTLNIPLSVDVRAAATVDATLYDGKTPTETSGTLPAMITAANGTDKIVVLNRNYAPELDVNADVTIDLNGYDLGVLTVSGGNVTIPYSKFGGEAGALTVNGGKAILNGGTFGSLMIGANGEVEQNGATFTGAATNNGKLTTNEGVFNGGLTSAQTLIINNGTFNGATAVTVSGGTADINRGVIEGTTYGLKVAAGGSAIVKKLAAIKGATNSILNEGGTVNVECGKFDGLLSAVTSFTSGYFTNKAHAVNVETGKEWMQLTDGVEYNEGYRFFLGNSETAKTNGVGVCRIGDVSYATLEAALAYANNNPSEENLVIFMTNNYTLPAGYYTLPANATLVVPMSDSQAKEVNKTAPRVIFNDADQSTPYVEPTEYRRLTIASGVNMDVFGNIEMTCSQFASNEAYTGQPTGAYGHIVMEEGSHMTLQDGSEVRAWGFMTGKGEIDARRGSIVREMFQLGDWKGAMTSVQIVGLLGGENYQKKIFPVTQYFIQNIESPVKYHPGSLLSTSAAVSEGLGFLSVSMTAADIGLIGVSRANSGGADDPAIFLMDIAADAENTWVRKWYDAENDIQVYDINSGAHIGSMVLDMGELFVPIGNIGTVPIKLNSSKFDLPLTCNFKIHLLTGGMDFKQNTSLLPGAEVEVDKEATVSVAQNPSDPEHTGALYVYDAEEWGKYAYGNSYGESAYEAYTKVVRYAPSWNGRPTKRDEQTKPASAKINVHGTFKTATGFVYTSESGANIFSSNEDAGTFIFNDDAENAGTREVYNVKGSSDLDNHTTFYPAKLKNGNGEHVNTGGAEAGDAYCYINDEWTTMYPDEDDHCFMVKHNTNGDIYYAKPAEYVAVVAAKEQVFEEDGITPVLDAFDNPTYQIVGNADHTYSDAAGAGRLFILMDNCQWWEVEKKDNLYHCIHPDNDTYYYWGEDNNGVDTWIEKKFTITWLNWDGTAITTNNGEEGAYKVTYGTMAEFLGTNPTRENNIDSTYNFTGWKPALGPVTQDVTYTATFESQPRMYTIRFLQEGGVEIERQFLEHNAVPVCENTPTKIGHTLVWSPAISPVIGDQTYTATWLENPPTEWDVTFVNNANGVLQATTAVGVNAHPEYSGETPVKENADHTPYSSSEYTYTFWGWSAVIDGVAQQFAAGTELPCPTAPTTYTAVYTEEYQTYAVTFRKEDPENPGQYITIETNNYRYGETPVCSATPTKENTAELTYGFAWTPNIQTVQGAATYTATFPATKNRYTVTLKSNLSGVCTFTGAGTFDYGTTINNVEVSYNDSKYTFNGWSDSETDAAHPEFTLTGDITLTANFTPKPEALNDHTVSTGETWNVTEDTEVKDLIITSDGSACGQLLNPENLTIRGEAIFRMNQSFDAGQWYAVAVPWRVNPATGIYGASGRLASGSQIYIIEFDGTAYANVGGTDDTNQYWHFLHETGADMVPGKLYMIYLASVQSKLDFHKKAGAALQTRNLTVSTASGSADASFANWNAISNPALYTADLSTGVTAYQTYDNNDGQTYTVVDEETSGLIVAKPIFVQVNTPGTVYATVPSGPDPAPAYRPVAQAENDAKYVIEISRNGKMADRLIVETADEKDNRYVIGQDLAKFGVSSKVAQMWINRYDSKLCKNTVEFDGERAEYPLSIFAPAAGDYTITNANANANAEYALYLTLNDEAIWNLSDGAYTLNLNKGTISNYGLRVSARAPQVVTGVDEAIVDAQGDTRKVLINNQVFIIRGNNVYSIDGQLIR